jgi:Carbohydrate family 9 binding domain-like
MRKLEFARACWSSKIMIVSASFSDIDFVPDGDLDKGVWCARQRVKFYRDPFAGIEYPEIETAVSILWTREYLYLGFWCRYEALHLFAPGEQCAEGSELWTRDVVEAFISPEESRESHYFEIEVSPDNRALELDILFEGKVIHKRAWQSGFDHATQVNSEAKIWTAEMRIPIRSMGAQIVPGVDWRINFFRADGVGSDEQRSLLSWAPLQIANRSFHQPESFGILRFESLEN